ncbi:MAG TPA: flagellar motor switch protein FliN [Bryobacteraceae bacterium]|nr:flagellar motor switch protein FliN [Bryobacteraceae bacterium]
MSAKRAEIENWLGGEFATRLAAAFEGMTGNRPSVESKSIGESPKDAVLRWRQPFSNVAGAMWVSASEAAWRGAGAQVLNAAGITDSEPAQLKAECLEIVGQALAGAGQAMGARLGIEVLPKDGQESDAAPGDLCWASVRVNFHAETVEVFLGIEAALISAFIVDEPAQIEPANPKSKTFELLLDVELPVSVSFGRAQVALKDVLKLTTGSIVELNRAIGDPVEVIVNNCVIARGEVVVVEGNFGVRIQQVISRQERLRTLN